MLWSWFSVLIADFLSCLIKFSWSLNLSILLLDVSLIFVCIRFSRYKVQTCRFELTVCSLRSQLSDSIILNLAVCFARNCLKTVTSSVQKLSSDNFELGWNCHRSFHFMVCMINPFCGLSYLRSYLRVGLRRLELPTSRLSGVRSNRLSYKPIFNYMVDTFVSNGDGEIRTLDPLLARQVLSQLSYAPVVWYCIGPIYPSYFFKSGGHLLSHIVSNIVPSAA